MHGERHRGTILRFQNDQKGVPSAARMPCSLRISRPAAEQPDALSPLESDRRSRGTARKTRVYPDRLRPPNPGVHPRISPLNSTSNVNCLQPLSVPFKLTSRIRSARRRSRSSTHRRSRKLPESSARKRINSGIKIRNKGSREACGFLSGTEECVGGGPSRREASRVWKRVPGGWCQ